MAFPILNLGLELSFQRLSHDFTISPASPKPGFADSELGKVISNKIALSKYLAVLKRKGPKTVTLKELDALQFELETLLLASVNRSKILLKEYSLLENKHKADTSIRNDTIHQNVQQTEPIIQLTSDSIKFAISAPTKKRKLSRKKDGLDKALAPQSTLDIAFDSTTNSVEFNSELSKNALPAVINKTNTPAKINKANIPAKKQKISRKKYSLANEPQSTLVLQFRADELEIKNQKVDTGLDSTTNSEELNSELTKREQPAKVNKTNTSLATSISLENLDKKNSASVGEKISKTSTKMENVEVTKKVLNKKTGRAIRIAQTRNANALNRIFAPARKYWYSVRSMCRYISETEIKAFEEVMKDQEATSKISKDTPVEGFFASEWAVSELNEEKSIASKTLIARKTTGLVSEDVLNMMRRAKKLIDQERSSEFTEAEPLYSHLLKSLTQKNLISKTKSKSKAVEELQSATEEALSKNSDIEEAMRADLVRAGILTKERIVRADSIVEKTDIDVEIQQLRGTLKALIKYNKTNLNHVLKLGKLEVRKHALTKQLINKGREIEKAYTSILAYKKKGEAVTTPIKKALKLVQEREIILDELNNLIV